MSLTPADLIRMTRAERESLYAASPAGPIPEGETCGYGLAGSWLFVRWFLVVFARLFLWQGKLFRKSEGGLINRILPPGFLGIRAQVYEGASWVDGKPAVFLDYSKTSFLARAIHDEVRQVAPDLYLGKVWWGKTPLVHFALRTHTPPRYGGPIRLVRLALILGGTALWWARATGRI